MKIEEFEIDDILSIIIIIIIISFIFDIKKFYRFWRFLLISEKLRILNNYLNNLSDEVTKFLKSYLIDYDVFFRWDHEYRFKRLSNINYRCKFRKEIWDSWFWRNILNEKRIIFSKILNEIKLLSKIVNLIIKCFDCFSKNEKIRWLNEWKF